MAQDSLLRDLPSPVDSEEDRLVFPINVHESLAASGQMKSEEKTAIIISFWLFGCGVLAWFLAGWLRTITPEYYVWLVILIELALQLTVGAFLLRILLDERTLLLELNNNDNSFAKYFSIYHEVIAGEVTPYPFDMMEFSDGSYAVYIQFLLGHNTNKNSAATYDVSKSVQQLINKSGMPHKILYCNERFSDSKAAENLRKVVNGVEEPQLFKAYRDIVQGLLTIANEESNVLSATYVIYARTRIQKDELVKLVSNILGMVNAEETAYREVSVLDYRGIVEFYRNYYKLDVLDMGLIRVHSVQKKNVYCPVKLLKVYGKSGKTYIAPDYTTLCKEVLDEYGLIQVNGKR